MGDTKKFDLTTATIAELEQKIAELRKDQNKSDRNKKPLLRAKGGSVNYKGTF